MDEVKKAITKATQLTATSVLKLINEKGFKPTDILTDEESLKREKLIDQAGVEAMAEALQDIQFSLEAIGSEGRKHVHQYGEALPTLMGSFGPPNSELKLDMVNDVVEGSKAAKLNLPGAVSVIAVSSHNGLMATPDDIDYMDKLFGPPQLKGKISIAKNVSENLTEVTKTFNVKPEKINVVIMDRERNENYISECKKFGVNLILIKAGDFLPSILACMDFKDHDKGVYILMGSGGFEEGILSAAAAKALGAMCEGRGWSKDPEVQKRYQQAWSVDELIPGRVEDCLVSLTAITKEDKWFNLPALATLTVDKSGVKIESN
jgi:fructose-1,6-bisphosphatase/sedoheptulose 1,7-bisphosphatase-like protein